MGKRCSPLQADYGGALSREVVAHMTVPKGNLSQVVVQKGCFLHVKTSYQELSTTRHLNNVILLNLSPQAGDDIVQPEALQRT